MEKTLQGEMDANLNFWNLCARMEAKGFRRLVSVEEAQTKLGLKAPNALIGYAFDDAFIASSGPALEKFLAAAKAAKDILATSDAEWDRIRPLMKMEDDATFLATRARYREGIPKRPVAEEEADAKQLYRVLHALGGAELMGEAAELDPGTYYKPKAAGN
jgi:NitT/TauT family transport system substrate-binding protein